MKTGTDMAGAPRRPGRRWTIPVAAIALLLAAACAGEAPAADSGGTSDGTADVGSAEPVAEEMTAEEVAEELGAVPEPSEPYRIAAIEKTLINEHWQQMQAGYEAAAEEYGVEVVVQASQDETDLTGQLALAENMLGQGFDAFSVSPLSDSNLQPFLDRAAEQGIPVLNVDDSRIDSRVFVGSDHTQMGVLAAQEIAERMPDGGEVAQIEGQAGSPAAQQRIEGFTGELENHEGLELVASVPADWDRQAALDAATNLLQSNPDLQAFYANNDTMALGVVEAVRNEGRDDVIVIGTDGVPDALDAIEAGEMTGTVASFPYQMGYTAVEMAIRVLEGQGVPEVVVSRQEMVTADNVDEARPDV